VVVFGIIVSLGLIAVSVALNVRMGYRSADSETDGRLYGIGAGLGDCLKAIAPFMLSWSLRHRDVLAAISAAALFGICTGYSFIAAFGFAAEHRANKAGVVQGNMDSYGDLRGEKKRLEGRLAFLGPQRSSREVEHAVKAVFSQRAWAGGQTVGALSGECTVNRKSTRSACERVANLQAELVRAQEAEQAASDLRAVFAKLEGRNNVSVAVDPQVDALAKVANLVTGVPGKEEIGLALSFLLACFIEVGSGVGLYMATTPWRMRGEGSLGAERRPRALGHVEGYMLERVEPGDGLMSVRALHDDYVRWCRRRNEVPYTETEFALRFSETAKDVGLEVTSRGQREYYRNIRVRPVG
jgi:hypothetical protein